MALTTIIASKESGYQPILLASFQFQDGSFYRCSTHNFNVGEGGNQYDGNDYFARIDSQDIQQVQARSEQGVDRIGEVTLHLMNADQVIWTTCEQDPDRGFKGAKLTLALVLMDIDPATGDYTFSTDSPAPYKFTGTCDAPSCENGGQTLTVRATTSHNLARVDFPILHVQQRCINIFPRNADERLAGGTDMSSWQWACGYNPDQDGTDPEIGGDCKRGNTTTAFATDEQGKIVADADGNFIRCNWTKQNCEARGMYRKDDSDRWTGRFTGEQWAPSPDDRSTQSIKYGKGAVTVSSFRNDSIYNRSYPMLYGTQWVKQPIVCNVLEEGNSTRCEVVICAGDIGTDGVHTVLVNGVIVPPVESSRDPAVWRWSFPDGVTLTSTHTGGRSGIATADLGYNKQGDPHGSVACIEVVVYSELSSGGSAPDVRVLSNGPKLKCPNTADPADQATWPYSVTNSPAWILLDLLIWGNYSYSEIDLQSFIDAFVYCDAPVAYVDLHGNAGTHPRFICQFALEDRRKGNEVIQAILRGCNGQLIPNSDSGLLQFFIRRSLADQQPAPIPGSNYNTAIDSLHADNSIGAGYPAYLIDESVIQQDGKGVPKIRGPYTLPSAQCPNRVSFPFQDQDNSHQDDSISVVDPDDVARAAGYQAGGAVIDASFSVLGIANFDQGIRAANVILAESLRGNGTGDSRGTYFFEIETTSRLSHLHVGHIVLFRYQALGLVPAGTLLELGANVVVSGATNASPIVITAASSFITGAEVVISGVLGNTAANGLFSVTHIDGTHFSLDGSTGNGAYTSGGRANAAAETEGILCRVEAIKATTNYERMTLTLRWHECIWYTDLYGQESAQLYSDPLHNLVRPPYPWKPYGVQPIADDSMFPPLVPGQRSTEWGFSIAQSYLTAADNSSIARLTIGGCPPVNKLSSGTARIHPPFMPMQASTANTGGTIPGGTRVLMSIAVRDLDGFWSQMSKFTQVTIPTGTDTNTAVTPTIQWPTDVAEWVLFGGVDDHETLCRQASGIGTTPATITITELAISTYGPPDPLADSIVVEVKRIVHGGVFGDACSAVDTDTITFSTALTTGQFDEVDATHGYDLSLISLGDGSTDTVPIANFHVVSNVLGVCTVTPDPVTAGIVPGMVFVMRCFPTVFSDTTIGDPNFVNAYAPGGLTVDAEAGQRVRILRGTGKGQERNIVSNTTTTLTVDPPWDTVPDSTSRFIVEESTWQDQPASKQSCSALTQSPVPNVAVVNVANYLRQTVLVRAQIADQDGRQSIGRWGPIREIYLNGSLGGASSDGLTFTAAIRNYGTISAEDIAIAVENFGLTGINFYLVYVDELTADCFATTVDPVDDGTIDDPVTTTIIPNPDQVSSLAFEVGDWILWNDPGNFEIGQLIAKVGDTWTIQRHYPGELAGRSTFEAPLVAHAAGIQLFKAQTRQFLFNAKTSGFTAGGVNRFDMPMPSVLVCAIVAAPFNNAGYGTWVTVNCASATVPGLRTCLGGEFSFQAESLFADSGVPVATNNFSVDLTQPQRANLAYSPVAITGADLVVNVQVTADGGLSWTTIETLTIVVGETNSWAGGPPPEVQQVPYSGSWPFRIFTAGEQLNFTIESGSAAGLTIKLDT